MDEVYDIIEDQLAQKLKLICDEEGKEPTHRLEETADIFYELGLLYMPGKENQNEVSLVQLIQSAGLFNAALVRKKNDASHIRKSLDDLCRKVLKLAGAQKQDSANLVEYSVEVKEKVEEMRKQVTEILKTIKQVENKIKEEKLYRKEEKKKISEIKELQEKLTDSFTKIMKDLCDYCEDVLGNPPEGYALAGLGSLARKEITPYSDFEHIILLREGCQKREDYKKVVEYFRWFTVVFQIVIINLQETTIRRLEISIFNDKTKKGGNWFNDVHTPCGISFDSMLPHGSKNPLGRQPTPERPFPMELIKPISHMLELLATAEKFKNGYNLKDTLMSSCFISGDCDIYKEFQSGVKIFRANNLEEQERDFITLVKEDIVKFGVRLKLEDIDHQSFEFEVKGLVYRVTTLFICSLGQIYDISAASCFDIIKELNKKEIISDNAKHKLSYAVAIACEIRLKHYIKLEGQYAKSSDAELRNGEILIEYVGERSILNYFQIAYALQNEILETWLKLCVAKKGKNIENVKNIKNKNFYPVPYLLNISVCWFLNLKEKCELMLNSLEKDIEQELEYLGFDQCIAKLEEEVNQDKNCEVTNEPNKNCNPEKLKLLIERCGAFFYDTDMSDICVEYYKRFLPNHNDNATSNETKYEIAVAQQIIGLSYMNLNNYTEAYQWLLKSYSSNKQLIKIHKVLTFTCEKIGLFLRDDCHEIDVPDINNKRCAEFVLKSIGEFLIEESVLMKQENNIRLANKFILSTLFNIGECCFWMKAYEQSKKYFQKYTKFYESLSDEYQELDVALAILTYMGQIYFKEEDYEQATECFKQCISELNRSAKNFVEYAKSTLFETGNLLSEEDQHKEALRYYRLYMDIQNYSKCSTRSIMITRIKINKCTQELGQYQQSLKDFKKCLRQLRQESPNINGDGIAASLYHHIGSCHYELQEYGKALTSFEKSLQIHELLQINENLAGECYNVGIMLRVLGSRNREANFHFHKAERIFQQIINLRNNKATNKEHSVKVNGKSLLTVSLVGFAQKTKFRLDKFRKKKLLKDASKTFEVLADMYLLLKKFKIALSYTKKALATRPQSSHSKSDEVRFFSIYWIAAKCQYYLKHFEIALTLLEKALQHLRIVDALDGKRGRVGFFCICFAFAAYYLVELERYDDASNALTQSKSYYRKILNPKIDLQNFIARVAKIVEENYFQFGQQHKVTLNINEIRSAGIMCGQSGKYEIAFTGFKKAWTIKPTWSRKECEEWYADNYYSAAKCLYYMNDHDRALIYFEKSLKHQNDYQDLTGFEDMVRCSWLFLYIADCLLEINRFDDVFNAVFESLRYFRLIPSSQASRYLSLQKDIFNVIDEYYKKVYEHFELLKSTNKENDKKINYAN